MLITLEEHEKQSRMDLAKHALVILQRAYPGYNWGVSCLGIGTIRITEAKALEWGGDQQCMSIHDTDWATINDFDALVRKYGGEFLERMNQSRTHNNGERVSKLPDGFNPRFARNQKQTRIKMVGSNGESLEEMRAHAQRRFKAEGLILPK